MRTFLTLACTVSALVACRAAERVLVLVPIGDSITQGGRADREEYTYRLPLQRLLHAEGIAYDFVGSRRDGLQAGAVWPDVAPGVPFDPDHEGHYGAKTELVRTRLRAALPGYAAVPDVALIHLGTNDQGSEDYATDYIAPLRDIVAALRERNPRVVVLIGHLNFPEGRALVMRPLAEALAEELDTPESPVRTVHHYRGFQPRPSEPDTDTFDWAHPNPAGQEKMARAWLEALRPFLHR